MLKQTQDAYSLVSDDFLQTVKESNVKEGGSDLRFICFLLYKTSGKNQFQDNHKCN